MRIFIWDKTFELKAEIDHDSPNFSGNVLLDIQKLIADEETQSKAVYEKNLKKIESGSLADYSDITAEDRMLLKDFADVVKNNPQLHWPSFYDDPEAIGFESEIWQYIDRLTKSKLCKFAYGTTTLETPEILVYAFCPELIEVAGRTTMRMLLTDIIRYDNPDICGDRPQAFLGELALQKHLCRLLSRFMSIL